MVPHPVRECVQAGGPVDEDEEDVGGGVADDVVGIVGVGGKRHGGEICRCHWKKAIRLVGTKITALWEEGEIEDSIDTDCLYVIDGGSGT